ncbi:MAG: ROK family protein [Clostridia bacterium]|nr:ROK family protein [Clostridia bacterium]
MYKIGIDLGGTNIAVGVVDENYNIIGRGKVKTNCPRPAAEIVADMVKAAKMAMEDAGITAEQVDGVGVGSPGAINSKDGIVVQAFNLDFFNVPVADMVKEQLGIDCFVGNDANAAAYGEYLAGSGKEADSFVMITLGTGVGGGVILDNRMLVGCNYAGAELGHIAIREGGEQCSCGRRGCWEAYASASALIRQAKKAMKSDEGSKLWLMCEGNIDAVDGKMVFDAMHAGDPTAKAVVNRYITYIAEGITDLINIFQPDILSIGGGICAQGDVITKPIQDFLDKNDFARGFAKRTQLKIATLGNDAGIIGAAYLGMLK